MAVNFKKIGADLVVETATKSFVTSSQKTLIDSALQSADIGATIQSYSDKLAAAASLSGDIAGTSDTQTLTNKVIDSASNTISNLAVSMFATSAIDTDVELTANSDTVLATQKAVKAYVDTIANGTTGALVFKGSFDASAGTFPSSSNTGYYYKVSVAGTVDGVDFNIGDSIFALVDAASGTTYALNWLKIDSTDSISSVAGRTGDITLVTSDITDLTASADEINYAAGVTSSIQAQLDGKVLKTDIDTSDLSADTDTKVPSTTAVKTYIAAQLSSYTAISSTKVSASLTASSTDITLEENAVAIFNIYVLNEGDIYVGFTHTAGTAVINLDDSSLDGKSVYVTYSI